MIPLPYSLKIIEKKDDQARFEIEGLYPGYGVTIGNSLRRVLISSLSGAAITQMKIKGFSHEFSTIPGVLEDVIIIMQNLKQLRFKIYEEEGNQGPQKASLKIKGIKKIKGSDFKFPSTVDLMNKNAHIATLTTKSAELDIEVQIEKGVGYSSRESRKKEKLEIGAILIDTIFTPIKRVSYKVENMRVGERTDFDRLFLDIETDGTIEPEAAFLQASEILIEHFSLLEKTLVPPENKISTELKKIKKPKKIEKDKKTKKPEKIKKVKQLKKIAKTPYEKTKKGKKTK